MYWSDYGLDTIERASMDGSSRSVIISTDLSTTYALTIDYDSQTLYWADYDLDRIESANTDGSNRTIVTTTSVSSPTAIAFFSGKLYWVDGQNIYSISLESSSVTSIRTSIGSDAYGIVVVAEETQPAS